MSKLYRSLLWSGLVVAGVAACGDDVTVAPPPPPPAPAVHSVSVAPNPGSITPGGNLQMIATVNADAGVATTVAWTSSNGPVVSVGASSGLATAIAAATPGTSVAITACSTVAGFTGVCNSATVNVVAANTPTVSQVNVNPPAADLQIGGTITPSAAVVGTNNPSQVVTWSLQTPGAIVSVNAVSGLITALAVGNAVVKACSTVAGFLGVCGSIAITVVPVNPASVQVLSVTWVPTILVSDGEESLVPSCIQGPGPSVPVILTNTRCQIEVTSQVNSGDQTLSRLDIVFTQGSVKRVLASQAFTVGPSGADFAPISANITLSMNTTQLRRNGSLFVPSVYNGNAAISANLYVVGFTTPIATPAIPVVMNNEDAALKIGTALTLVNNSSAPSFTDGAGNVWFTGTQTAGAVNYIAFSNTAPTTVPFGSTVCGASNSSAVTGTPTAGMSVSSTFNCTTVEGGNALTGVIFGGITYPTLVGPDGTPIVAAAAFNNIGTAFCVPIAGNSVFTNLPPGCDANSDQRWNMFTPGTAPTIPAAVFVDNKVPSVCVQRGILTVVGAVTCTAAQKVAFNDLFDQNWVNDPYNFLTNDVISSDGGTGVASEAAFNHAPSAVACSTASPVITGVDVASTVTSDGTPEGHRICGRATDNIGNVSGLTGFSNFFGKDNVAPPVRLAGSTVATPLIAPATFPAVSAIANTTIFSIAAPFTATDAWGLEANDDASGFDQNLLVAGFPATETMTILNPNGSVSACGFTPGLPLILSDNFVRVGHLPGAALLDCGLAGPQPGYFTFKGFVTDRAGNASVTITRNYAIDQYFAPVLASVGPSTIFFTPGLPAAFFLFGSDDLEIVEADVIPTYPGMNAVTVTLVSITKSLSAIGGAARWDATLTNILAGASAIDPFWLGRVDLTCTGAGTPYAGCLVVDGPALAADYNNVDTDADLVFENDDKNATTVGAIAYDVARQPSGQVNAGLLTAQTTPDPPEQWSSATAAGMITWRVTSTAAGVVTGQWVTTSSLVPPYFDQVQLARENAGATSLITCATSAAPVRTDNGIQRTFAYTIAKPAVPLPCSAGGLWYLIGIKNGAALVTIGLP